jgi:hypothetical protein
MSRLDWLATRPPWSPFVPVPRLAHGRTRRPLGDGWRGAPGLGRRKQVEPAIARRLVVCRLSTVRADYGLTIRTLRGAVSVVDTPET